MPITRKSSIDDVASFLKENTLGDIVKSFKDNEIDGEVFYDLEYRDILETIPRLKTRKTFIKVFGQVTGFTFDVDGKRCPLLSPVNNGKSSSAEEDCCSVGVSVSHDVNSPGSSSSEESHQEEEEVVSQQVTTPRQSKKPADQTPVNASRGKTKRKIPDDSDDDYEDGRGDSPVIPKQLPVSVTRSSSNCKGKEPMNSGENESGNLLKDFVLPSRWQPHVEQALKRGGPLNTAEKNTLVRQICDSIMGITNTVYKREREHIALMLVEKYPFLKGSFGAGHQMWAEKINERIWNLKRLAKRNEKKRLQEEGVDVPKGQPGRKGKKKDISEVPLMIQGETKDTLESQRLDLLKLWKTSPKDAQNIRSLMEKTFPLRRSLILKEDARLWKILQDYPAFRDTKGNELKAELGRILGNPNIVKEMKETWEMKKPTILSALKSEKKQEIHSILFSLEECDPADEKELEDRCIMACLPHALGEKTTNKVAIGELFWHITSDKDDVDNIISSSTSPRLVSSGSLEQLDTLCLVAEGMVVCKFRNTNIFNAVIALLGCFYMLNACFPIGSNGRSKNVYLFLEHVLINSKKQLPTGVENFAAALNL